MKKVLTLCLSLLGATSVWADNVIRLNDETLIEDFNSISFDPVIDGNILIHYTGSTVSVNMNILKVLPNETSSNGIEEVEAAKFARISQIVGDQLVIEGANAGDLIRLYSTSGVLMTQCKATGERVTISLSNCKESTYILCIGSKVVKFNKK